MGIWRSASWTYTMPSVVRKKKSPYTPSTDESRPAAAVSAAPTLVGSAEAMFAKMRMEVPLPSLSSEIVSAACRQAGGRQGR